jgi:SAM-dependent methyltransferase
MNALAQELAVSAPIAPPVVDWAKTYDRLAQMEAHFTVSQVDMMELSRSKTVLDVGAGSGRLAIPMARKSKSVTALDTCPDLLGRCGSNAREAGLPNVVAHQADWDALVPGKDIPKHDVVVASRFNGELDLMKLDSAAKELVYVQLFSGPSTKALLNALLEGIVAPEAEAEVEQSGVSAIFNELTGYGIEPNVVHVPTAFTRWYRDENEALADFNWLGVDSALQPILHRNIRRFVAPAPHGGFRFQFDTKCAIVWWRK